MSETPEKDPAQTSPVPQPPRHNPSPADGTDIHIKPGQEHELPHEGTHQPPKPKPTGNPVQE